MIIKCYFHPNSKRETIVPSAARSTTRTGKKERKRNQANQTLVICYIILYMFGLVPAFRSSNTPVRLFILLIGHPILKTVLEYGIRDSALRSSRKPHFACDGLFACDSIFGLVGRFFIVTSGGKGVDGALLAILFAGVQQYMFRSMRLDLTRFSRWLRGKPPMTELEIARFKSIVAVEERQCMTIEIACILVATVFELALWDLRWIFDLGYPRTAERAPVSRTLLLCAVQIACEAVVDILSMYRELKSGIPLLHVWTGRNRLWVCREMVQMTLAAVVICLIYHVVPYAGFCERPDDVCSCSFTTSLPAVSEYCGSDAIGVDGAEEAALANLTSALRQCAGGALLGTQLDETSCNNVCDNVCVDVCTAP